MINKSIQCKVDSCKHHSDNHCTLSGILVERQCDCANERCETECYSFENK